MNKVYIELGDAVNSIKGLIGNCDHRFYNEGLTDACSELIGLKPADVAPVICGNWLEDGAHGIRCSNCSYKAWNYHNTPYCPNCGSRNIRR